MQKILGNTRPEEIACSTPLITGKLDEVQQLEDKKNDSPENI